MLDSADCSRDTPLSLRKFDSAVFDGGNLQRVFPLYNNIEVGTNRVIRKYERTREDSFRLVERNDWEVDLSEAVTAADEEVSLSHLTSMLGPTGSLKDMGAVVLKEQGHGVVSDRLIKTMTSTGLTKNAAWFVSTKEWCPNWFQSLPTCRGAAGTQLLMIQPESAHKATYWELSAKEWKSTKTAIPEPKGEVSRWLYSDGTPTRRALLAIRTLRARYSNLAEAAIAVLPSRTSMILSLPTDKQGNLLTYVGPRDPAPQELIPRSSVLFTALAYYSLESQPDGWFQRMKKALFFADCWVAKEFERIARAGASGLPWSNDVKLASEKDPNVWGTTQQLSDLIGDDPAKSGKELLVRAANLIRVKQSIRTKRMEDVDEAFDQAFRLWPTGQQAGYGIIESSKSLELWRAETEVDGCIACMRKKRGLLTELSHQLEVFDRPDSRRSQAFYIGDDPGGGKSTLVRKLAESHQMRFVSFNITEMVRRQDLLGYFDLIVTTQAQERDRSLLVFVDEINANLEGHSVYSSFLAPLEDGHYSRDGKAFQISPCVWVFVGTSDIRSGSDLQHPSTSLILDTVHEDLGGSSRRANDLWKAFLKTRKRLEQQLRRIPTNPDDDRARKVSDFNSRLTLPPFILNSDASNNTLSDREKLGVLLQRGRGLERVYVGAHILKQLYPDVQTVSDRVLKAFAMLRNGSSLRELRHDLEQCNDVQRGRVRVANLPHRFLRRPGHVWQCVAGSSPTDLSSWLLKVGSIGSLLEDQETESDVSLVLKPRA